MHLGTVSQYTMCNGKLNDTKSHKQHSTVVINDTSVRRNYHLNELSSPTNARKQPQTLQQVAQQEYNKSFLNILCVTKFVTSSLALFEAAIWVKATRLITSCLKIRQKKRKNGKKRHFLHKSPSKRLIWNGIHGLLRRDDARGNANIIYRIWRLSLVYRLGIVIEVKK